MTLLVAIDGPAAAGKGTLARRIADRFGLRYLDTGKLYRAVGRLVLDRGGDPASADAALAAAAALRAEDLERNDLRTKQTDRAASMVAAQAPVRHALLDFQRRFADDGAVLDGRDIGTVILPNADVKLFVTATLAARAARRHSERAARGEAVSLEEVAADMARRDALDQSRSAAPLRPAPDALQIDTTDLDPDAVFARAVTWIEAALAARGLTRSG